ncbi:hypothetical protein JCM11491_005195 [Sporobolomyces phaffii]
MPARRDYTRLATEPPRPRSPPGLAAAADLAYSVTSSTADKGKGKATQRATGCTFAVRFTDGTTPDVVDLYVTPRETVRDVKHRLRLIRPAELQDPDHRPRRLRLIQLGRILADGVCLVPYTLQLAENRKKLELSTTASPGIVGKVGSFLKDGIGTGDDDEQSRLERGEAGPVDAKGKGKECSGERDAEEQIWLHCSVGDVIQDEEAATNEMPVVEQQTTPLQGFDRLREAGFSEEEIETMRAEFRERRGVYTEPGDDDDAEHQRALEEQWMSGMTGQEEASGDSTGTGHYVTLLKGVCVGFFMPFLPLFFFRTQVFSRRMQMAIVLGILVNLGFGLLRLLG